MNYSPLDLDDDLSAVAAELRVVAAALDSRSIDLDRRQARDLISVVWRQVGRLNELRAVVNSKIVKGDGGAGLARGGC